jgi:Acyl-CoA carboxylase epsilon subunit
VTETAATQPAVTEPSTARTASIRIERGEPTPEELAAVLAVLAAAGAGRESAAPSPAPESRWTDRSRYVRGPVSPAPNGWRAAGFPR